MTYGNYRISETKFQVRMQCEEKLEFANALMNQVVDAAFCLGEEGQFLYVNDATCLLTEYSREELLTMTLHDIEVEFSHKNWSKQWQRLKRQSALKYQSRYRTKKGEIYPIEITINYVEHQGKEFICAFAHRRWDILLEDIGLGAELGEQQQRENAEDSKENLSREVFEYQKTETELATSLYLLSSTLESTVNGIVAVNCEGEILCYNQKFIEMWHLPEGINLSKKNNKAKEFFENQVKNPEVFCQAIWDLPIESERESYDLLELKDGRIFAHYSEPQRLGEKIIGRVWSVWDITEYKRTEEALKLNESRFRTLAETTEASIFLIHDRHICYVNPAAEDLSGYQTKDLLDNFNIDRLFKKKKLRQVNRQNGETACGYQEMQLVTKDGKQRWLACTVVMLDGVLDFANQQVEMITAIDITDYKQSESEVRQALEQAKRLSELRERFVSMLCHQFRTPLNVVSFSADLLRRHIHQWTEEKNRSYLDLIQVGVQQISELLDEILLYGKAEASRLVCQPKPLNLERFCRDILAQVQLASGNQRIIKYITKGDCELAYLDPKLLQHILTNLLSNAIKYSPNDKRVDFELEYDDENNVVFQIRDMGIGIPVVDQQQIFEPFYRGSNVDNIPGTGLGLSIVKTLVELHTGKIAIESEVGVGTTFTVKLPSASPDNHTQYSRIPSG
jgi:PAS domain S-box-containing protein